MKKKSTKESLLAKLRQHLPELSKEYNIKALGIFGSYVHEKQKKGSDLDILIEFKKNPGLFTFVGLENKLSDIIGIKVDLVSKNGLSPYLKERILGEVQQVYGQR